MSSHLINWFSPTGTRLSFDLEASGQRIFSDPAVMELENVGIPSFPGSKYWFNI